MLLRYYTDEEFARGAYPPGVVQANLDTKLTPEQVRDVSAKVRAQIEAARATRPYADSHEEDRREHELYIQRITARLKQLGQPA
jgi:hypothetical protein